MKRNRIHPPFTYLHHVVAAIVQTCLPIQTKRTQDSDFYLARRVSQLEFRVLRAGRVSMEVLRPLRRGRALLLGQNRHFLLLDHFLST